MADIQAPPVRKESTQEPRLRKPFLTVPPHLQLTKTPAPDFFLETPIFGVHNLLWGKIKPGDTTVASHEDVLRYGARYTVEEAVELISSAHPEYKVDNKRVSTRLSDAKDMVAKAYGVERAMAKRQFDEAQTHFGAKKRKDALAATRRRRGGISKGGAMTGLVGMTPDEEVKMSTQAETELAAGILVGLSGTAWAKRTGVKECEKAMSREISSQR